VLSQELESWWEAPTTRNLTSSAVLNSREWVITDNLRPQPQNHQTNMPVDEYSTWQIKCIYNLSLDWLLGDVMLWNTTLPETTQMLTACGFAVCTISSTCTKKHLALLQKIFTYAGKNNFPRQAAQMPPIYHHG